MQARFLWISCRIDLVQLKQVVEDEINLESQSCVGNFENFDNLLHPHLVRELSDCMRKNNFLFGVTGEEEDSSRTSYLESLFKNLDASEQNLHLRLRRSTAEMQSPVSGPSPAPVSGPAPAAAPGSKSANSPAPKAPPFFPLVGVPPPHKKSGASASQEEEPHPKNHQMLIVVVAVTAGVTFSFAGLLFFCCMKFCMQSPGAAQNDERPLLSLSMNDYSTGICF